MRRACEKAQTTAFGSRDGRLLDDAELDVAVAGDREEAGAPVEDAWVDRDDDGRLRRDVDARAEARPALCTKSRPVGLARPLASLARRPGRFCAGLIFIAARTSNASTAYTRKSLRGLLLCRRARES